MELTKEQLSELEDIAKLPKEQQQKEINKFLSKLNPEQRAFLEQQNCLFCNIASGKIKSYKVYEDNNSLAILDINPANLGHLIFMPKKHYMFSWQVPIEVALLEKANRIAERLVKAVNASGLNLFVANGEIAGQRIGHVVAHLIPRFDNDGINFDWNAKKVSEQELSKLANILKKKFEFREDVKEVKKKEVIKIDREDVRIP